MQCYPYSPGFIIGQSLTLCLQPGCRFGVAVFRQGAERALERVRYTILLASGISQWTASNRKKYYLSNGSFGPMRFDTDWQWPELTIRIDGQGRSDVYIAVAYEVGDDGVAMTPIGRKVQSSADIYPCPPDSDAMALFVAQPRRPVNAKVVYIVPVATYHAYNLTGNGCFYGYQPRQRGQEFPGQSKVTLRRPGGGLGAFMGEPEDWYDKASPRQQFEHWDAKFIRWIKKNNIQCDFYTDLDLHTGNLALSYYQLMLSVGHHEYWSQLMRDSVGEFIRAGGNYACFSGNTCFRPVNFGDYRKAEFMNVMFRLADHWPNFDEWELIKLSYNWGGGKWGSPGRYFQQWSNTERPNYGYTVTPGSAGHWVFAGTGLTDGASFGGGNNDYLVGYECDGRPPQSTLQALATSPTLGDFMDGAGNRATFGIVGDKTGVRYQRGVVFNAGTTDWARVMTDTSCASRSIVETITRNVITTLSDRPG